ncbi:MAG: hypothetical protein A2017_05565 [Lentisphaerae bacterium GWF2_44_16]|nr:MAG: hypothetical protein A2017_05565 [Lentisphaerae bacterium GWF2_44_16]
MEIDESVKNEPAVLEYLENKNSENLLKALSGRKDVGIRNGILKKLTDEDWKHSTIDVNKVKPCGGCGGASFARTQDGTHPMQCINCVSGHLASAMTFCSEIIKGYDGVIFADKPNHVPLMFGDIEHAERQCVKIFPALSEKIRQLKLKTQNLKTFNFSGALTELNNLFWETEELKNNETEIAKTENL